MLKNLPDDVITVIMDKSDIEDRVSLLLAHPGFRPHFTKSLATMKKCKFRIDTIPQCNSAIDFFMTLPDIDLHTLHLESVEAFHLVKFLNSVDKECTIQNLIIHFKRWTKMDEVYLTTSMTTCAIMAAKVQIEIESDETQLVPTLYAEDPPIFNMSPSNLLRMAKDVRVLYINGTLRFDQSIDLLQCTKLWVEAGVLCKAFWQINAPELEELYVSGRFRKERVSNLSLPGGYGLVDGLHLKRVTSIVYNQREYDLVSQALSVASKIDELTIVYKMPLCIDFPLWNVKNLHIQSDYSMMLDIMYHDCLDIWSSELENMTISKLHNECLFTVRIVEANAPLFEIFDALKAINFSVPECTNVEIDRF